MKSLVRLASGILNFDRTAEHTLHRCISVAQSGQKSPLQREHSNCGLCMGLPHFTQCNMEIIYVFTLFNRNGV